PLQGGAARRGRPPIPEGAHRRAACHRGRDRRWSGPAGGDAAMTMMEASLGEVAELVRGVTFKPDDVVELGDEGSDACLRTKNVHTELHLTAVWSIPRRLVKSADRFVREGDIVISTANSWNLVGKVSWIPRLEWEATA